MVGEVGSSRAMTPRTPGAELMLTSTADATPADIVWASVHVEAIRINYWRAGTGPPVLILGSSAESVDPHDPWVRALTGRFRLLAPVSPVGPDAIRQRPFARWLRCFLDGLGLERVAVLAYENTAAEVLWLALSESERIDRVVFVLSEPADPACPDGLPFDRLEQSHSPVLLVRMNLPDGSAAAAPSSSEFARMLRFLSGEG
jgi:pimeloyl-ACP methyl ester carboxylesterase